MFIKKAFLTSLFIFLIEWIKQVSSSPSNFRELQAQQSFQFDPNDLIIGNDSASYLIYRKDEKSNILCRIKFYWLKNNNELNLLNLTLTFSNQTFLPLLNEKNETKIFLEKDNIFSKDLINNTLLYYTDLCHPYRVQNLSNLTGNEIYLEKNSTLEISQYPYFNVKNTTINGTFEKLQTGSYRILAENLTIVNGNVQKNFSGDITLPSSKDDIPYLFVSDYSNNMTKNEFLNIQFVKDSAFIPYKYQQSILNLNYLKYKLTKTLSKYTRYNLDNYLNLTNQIYFEQLNTTIFIIMDIALQTAQKYRKRLISG